MRDSTDGQVANMNAPTGHRPGRIRVLMHPPVGKKNPSIVMLVESLPDAEVEVEAFTWRRAIFGRYDVIHIHWPELLFGGTARLSAALRVLLFVLMTEKLIRLEVSNCWKFKAIHSNFV